jgi:hypothetical protein
MNKLRRKQLAAQPVEPQRVRLSCALAVLAADLATADAATPGTPDLSPKWVQVATAGAYNGYGGGAFTFDDKVFAQIITNFRAHPSYVKGAAGVGVADVIPWDFNHASAAFAADGSIPITGTPAQGWVQDLKTVADAAGTQLWALTRWLEPARTYIVEKRYQWSSVVVGFDCRDAKTNANIGAVLESIALTNNPFIEGMQRLAADKRGGPQGKQMTGKATLDYWYGRTAASPEDAFTCLRDMLGLPGTADIGAVLAELLKLQTWATSGGAPIGVDLDTLVSNVRTIFNMPALSSTEEVFAESSKLLGALLQQQALEQMETATPPASAPAQVPPAMPNGATGTMEKKHMSILKLIASRTGVVETEAAVTQAVEGMFAFRASLAKKLSLAEHVADTVLLEAAGSAVSGAADARGKLGALLAALGIEDANGAVEKIAGLMKQSADLEAAMPELKSLREAAAAADAKDGDAEVEKVMNSLGTDNAGVKVALGLMRKTDKAAFHKQYEAVLAKKPEPAVAGQQPGHAYLTTQLTGAPGGAERKIVGNADGSVSLSAPGAGSKVGAPTGGKTKVDLSKQQGRNRTERAMDYIKASVAGADKWDFNKLFEAAVKLCSESEIVDAA